ncbi:hypothetical protein ACOME3_005191 [Neoechinorhynchus agilis]
MLRSRLRCSPDAILLKNLCENFEISDILGSIERKMLCLDLVETLKKWLKSCYSQVYGILTGSCYLRTELSTSDIDMIAIGPEWLSELEFVNKFVAYLEKEQNISPRVSRNNGFCVVSLIPGPHRIKIDVVYVRVNGFTESTSAQCEHIDLDKYGIDEHSKNERPAYYKFVLRGYTLLVRIRNLSTGYNDKMVLIIQTIKRWAKGHDLCGNIKSIPSVAWTVMIIRIYLPNKKANLIYILEKFFSTYARWDWAVSAIVWNKESNDKCPSRSDDSLMEVRLPYYPFTNVTANVPSEKFQIMKLALTEAAWTIVRGRREVFIDWFNFFG